MGAMALLPICDSSFTCEDYNTYRAHPWSSFPPRPWSSFPPSTLGALFPRPGPGPHTEREVDGRPGKVDVRLPGKGNSNSHAARPVHLIITMIKWIRTSRLSIKNSLWTGGRNPEAYYWLLDNQWWSIKVVHMVGVKPWKCSRSAPWSESTLSS